MMGRYGVDQLSRFLNIIVIILLFISMLSRVGTVYLLAVALMIYSYFRIFSRNRQRRYAENMRWLNLTSRARGSLQTAKRDAQIRRTHHLYRCPSCRQKIRVPRGKGRIAVSCPRCSTEFIKKS